jgi:Family of unknown function (DUF6221)
MNDLVAFLAARLGEAEALARRALIWQPLALRMVEAGRAILAEHAGGYPGYCAVCHAGGFDWDPERWPCATVRALAAVYSDHPDYRDEWKP